MKDKGMPEKSYFFPNYFPKHKSLFTSRLNGNQITDTMNILYVISYRQIFLYYIDQMITITSPVNTFQRALMAVKF